MDFGSASFALAALPFLMDSCISICSSVFETLQKLLPTMTAKVVKQESQKRTNFEVSRSQIYMNPALGSLSEHSSSMTHHVKYELTSRENDKGDTINHNLK